ncbi:hypothetical protein J2X63_002059 [Agromyces sp. 3263]|uniref:hypothetical protein n=1 Tax=Agromyces sp. 3263 TaxID=2817750 RepID=UPI0028618B74|nr:hypothetical protein [Agromyces sp. 3263]MDR6906373.1 hypothetical protein [Agromyces sp. 3263]
MRHRKVGDDEADDTGRRIGNGRPASAVVPAAGVAPDREAAPLTLAGVQRVAGNRAAAELVASDGVSARASGGIVRLQRQPADAGVDADAPTDAQAQPPGQQPAQAPTQTPRQQPGPQPTRTPAQTPGQQPAQGVPQQGAAQPATAAPRDVDTTDVPYPPARPSIQVARGTPVVVAGAAPPAAETAPVHGIDTTVEFWGVAGVAAYVDQLVDGWRTRRAAQGQTVDVAATRASFVTDFDETMQGWYQRSSFSTPFAGLDAAVLRQLNGRRTRLAQAVANRRVVENGRRRPLTADERSAQLEAELVVERQLFVDKIVSHLTEGAWGWMLERREHLDFTTVTQRGVRELRNFAPGALPNVDAVALVRGRLAARNRALTDPERARAIAQAESALRRRTRDPKATLDAAGEEAAIVAAETRKFGGQQQVDAAVREAAIDIEERGWENVHELDANGRPAWGSVWGRNSIGVMTTTAIFVLWLIDAYGAGFTADNYGGHGGGGFAGRGRSLDLTIPQRRADGFFDAAQAITFGLAIDRAASAIGVEWRVIYDDFSVARAVNERLGQRRIIEVANTSRGRTGDITNINWHGPLVNHFHLDLAF